MIAPTEDGVASETTEPTRSPSSSAADGEPTLDERSKNPEHSTIMPSDEPPTDPIEPATTTPSPSLTPSPVPLTQTPPDSILQRLAQHAQRTPDKIAITYLNPTSSSPASVTSKWTCSQLYNAVEYLAHRLLPPSPNPSNKGSNDKGSSPLVPIPSSQSPLTKGDRILLVYPPCCPHFLLSFLACLRCGLVAVPTYPPHPTRKDSLAAFAGIAIGCGAKVALTNGDYWSYKRVGELKDAFGKFGGGLKGRFVKKKQDSSEEVDAGEEEEVEAKWPEDLVWVVTDDEPLENPPSPASSAATAAATEHSHPHPTPTDKAFLQYTSGSTSLPKGVTLLHSNLSHNLSIITSDLNASSETCVVSWLPQYHDMGLIGSLLGIIYCGGRGYYMSPMAFLQRPMVWLECVSEFGASHLQAPNFAFGLVARKFDPDGYYFDIDRSKHIKEVVNEQGQKLKQKPLNLSSLLHVINGAEPVTVMAMNAFHTALAPFGLPMNPSVVYPTYGLAEHTVFVCSGGKGKLTVKRKELEEDNVVVIVKENGIDKVNENIKKEGDAKSERDEVTMTLLGCGFPSRQNVDVQIVDPEQRNPLNEDTVGEIWINSPSKAAGYFGKEDVTREAFYAKLTDGVGDYLRSGDLGFLHRGELYICGRLKDLIIVGGRNHYPQDLEATAEFVGSDHTRPGCSAAFSVASAGSSEGDGEDVILVMELKETLPKQNQVESVCKPLVEQIRSEISKEHSLSLSCIVLLKTRTVPKTTSGKISRSRARKAYVKGTLEEVYRKQYGSGDCDQNDASTPTPAETSNEVLDPNPSNSQQSIPNTTTATHQKLSPDQIRALDKPTIKKRLITAICQIANIDRDSVQDSSSLASIMDSVSLAQFKGLLEGEYGVKTLSDEYLFRDTTTLNVVVEVVKIGHAKNDTPDAEGGGGGGASNGGGTSSGVGSAGGLAGALGCPPGVVCCTVM